MAGRQRPAVPRRASALLDAQLEMLRNQSVVELRVQDSAELVRAPDPDPFAEGPQSERSGIEDAVAVLMSDRHLPAALTIRLVVSGDAPDGDARRALQAAMSRRADALAESAWREAMAMRSLGRRQLPIGLVISVLAAFGAYGLWAIGSGIDDAWVAALLWAFGGLLITVAWVVSWMVIEVAFLDWRPFGRTARAYETVADASLEVVAG